MAASSNSSKAKMKSGAAQRYRVLLVEDGDSDYGIMGFLSKEKSMEYDFMFAGSVADARRITREEHFDVVISEYIIGQETVFDLLDTLKGVPVIVVTGSGNEEVAVRAFKAGASDYVVRDSGMNYLKVLPVTIENAIGRKRSEERQILLESAVLNANDAIIILEAEPGEKRGRRILFVNRAFTRMTGFSFDEAVGNTLRMLRGPRTSLSTLNKIRLALDKGVPIRVELINYRKDGTEVWVECNIVPFADEQGRFMHWVSVQRDITERKRAEEERERLLSEIEAVNADLSELNHELETIGAERTMSLMALTVADRIRNPAAMIGARCRRLLSKNPPDHLKEGLAYIMEGAEKLERIVSEFEVLLKEKQYKFRSEELNSIVSKVLSVSMKEARNRGIDLRVNLGRGMRCVNMQKDLLRMAVFHLVKNAVESTPEGGVVEIATFMENDYAVLSVKDTGYGIPPEEIDNIFRPFFSTKEHGFGLGLPLVKQIVSEHLGTLDVNSTPGKGTEFRLKFPTRWIEEKLYKELTLRGGNNS
jgi:hypothetical protein